MPERWSVLVVEDDEMLQQLYETEFVEAGFEFHLAPNGAVVEELLRTHAIDVVVTDVNMPESGGDAVLALMRRVAPHTPVVVVTAHEKYQKQFREQGLFYTAYFMKPVDYQDLARYLRGVLEGRLGPIEDNKPPHEAISTDSGNAGAQRT